MTDPAKDRIWKKHGDLRALMVGTESPNEAATCARAIVALEARYPWLKEPRPKDSPIPPVPKERKRANDGWSVRRNGRTPKARQRRGEWEHASGVVLDWEPIVDTPSGRDDVWVTTLATTIAEAFGCTPLLFGRDNVQVRVVGLPDDIESVRDAFGEHYERILRIVGRRCVNLTKTQLYGEALADSIRLLRELAKVYSDTERAARLNAARAAIVDFEEDF